MSFPYTRYACPCTDITPSTRHFRDFNLPIADVETEEEPFNPHSLRANYALFPLNSLLFCNDCHEIRCPRCYYEETVHHFCPNCLFEVGKATVKNETNRCTRSCFECPLCTSTLSISSYQLPDADTATETEAGTSQTSQGPFILTCPYCAWSSLDIGVTFDKSTNISGQLAKQKGSDVFQPKEEESVQGASHSSDQYQDLISFYKQQFTETNPTSAIGAGSGFGLDSPNLFRLLSNYGHAGLRKPKGKVPSMREAETESEGLLAEDSDGEQALIQRLSSLGWDNTASVAQQRRQNNDIRSTDQLRPVPMLLRSKRAKRCRKCRHQLAKQDDKLHSTKWRIRLVAVNYIPLITVRPFSQTTASSSLVQQKTVHFLITFRNPLFDPVKVSLATPRITPGRVQNKVTLLCPQFDMGPAADVWDEALDAGASRVAPKESAETSEGAQPFEAGKVWEKGRNWTTVACEIVPGSLNGLDLHEGEDVLDIPIHVRVSYETDETSVTSPLDVPRDGKSQKEIAFWTVLGMGRVKSSR